jgi:hypothetical protein
VLTTPELSLVSGCPTATVHKLRRHGRLVPARVGTPGCRSGHRWHLGQALALAAWRALRSRGVCPSDAEVVRGWLERLTGDELQAHFAAGREVLLVTADRCPTALVTTGTLLAAVGDSAGCGTGLIASGVHVKQLHRHLQAEAVLLHRNGHAGSESNF